MRIIDITQNRDLLNRYFAYVVSGGFSFATGLDYVYGLHMTMWLHAACALVVAGSLFIKPRQTLPSLHEDIMLTACLVAAAVHVYIYPEDLTFYAWFTMVPVIFFLIGGATKGFLFSGLLLVAYLFGVTLYQTLVGRPGIVPQEFYLNGLAAYLFVTMLAFVYAWINRNLQALLAAQAYRDCLTGAYNRRAIHDMLEHTLEISRRHQNPLSLLMIDIDYFK
ncbi:MAG: diguanylate cyclase, partial [Halothiobacillaceae bacterium]